MSGDFDKVLDIVGLEAVDIALVKKAGVKKFTHFATTSPEKLDW
jgi:hypothetical protein